MWFAVAAMTHAKTLAKAWALNSVLLLVYVLAVMTMLIPISGEIPDGAYLSIICSLT